jgi:hypothetical protein
LKNNARPYGRLHQGRQSGGGGHGGLAPTAGRGGGARVHRGELRCCLFFPGGCDAARNFFFTRPRRAQASRFHTRIPAGPMPAVWRRQLACALNSRRRERRHAPSYLCLAHSSALAPRLPHSSHTGRWQGQARRRAARRGAVRDRR